MRGPWLIALATVFVGAARAADPADTIRHPRAHFRVADPASLDPPAAETVYRRLLRTMLRGYALSGEPGASYAGWRRYNRHPYRSATHGERYVNNYANRVARAYGRFENAGKLPPGSLLAKDSFTVTAAGGVYPGPLFLMEKLAPGTSPETDDWRYVMVMPDGSLFGDTTGDNSGAVAFCAVCHGTTPETDDLFFLPPALRVRYPRTGARE